MRNWFWILLVGTVCSCSTKVVTEKANIKAIAETVNLSDSMRKTMVRQTAREFGAQSGLAWQGKILNQLLKKNQSRINTIFNFNFLVLGQQVLPPILEEAENRLEVKDDQTIAYADHLYKIIQMPKLVSVLPSWKNYLMINFSKPETPSNSLLPKTIEEKQIWNKYVQKGWFEGVEQANQIFELGLNRLVRDFQGMILYRKLLAQNIVTPPYLAKVDLGIVGNAEELHINQRILKITAVSKFNQQSKTWRPVIPSKLNNRYLRESKEGKNGMRLRNDSIK